jgi:DNA-binding transcriptional MocR family regulator
VFVELAAIYNGGNNGFLALSARDAAERTGCSKNTASLALKELRAKGFIELAQRGHFDRKSPHAAEYRLTLYECNRTGQRGSKAFMGLCPDQLLKSVTGPIRGTAGPISSTAQDPTQ